LTVKYHTVTPDDNGITDGTFRFVVGSAAATPAPDVTATPATPESGEATPPPAATATTAESAAATPVATPAALPSTGESRANTGWIIGLLGVALAGGGLAVRRLTR
jgi:LPXTG-motif cell wall-anchored protein